MDNESLENKNETMKEVFSMICAQKPNDKIETVLKGLNFAGITNFMWFDTIRDIRSSEKFFLWLTN